MDVAHCGCIYFCSLCRRLPSKGRKIHKRHSRFVNRSPLSLEKSRNVCGSKIRCYECDPSESLTSNRSLRNLSLRKNGFYSSSVDFSPTHFSKMLVLLWIAHSSMFTVNALKRYLLLLIVLFSSSKKKNYNSSSLITPSLHHVIFINTFLFTILMFHRRTCFTFLFAKSLTIICLSGFHCSNLTFYNNNNYYF